MFIFSQKEYLVCVCVCVCVCCVLCVYLTVVWYHTHCMGHAQDTRTSANGLADLKYGREVISAGTQHHRVPSATKDAEFVHRHRHGRHRRGLGAGSGVRPGG